MLIPFQAIILQCVTNIAHVGTNDYFFILFHVYVNENVYGTVLFDSVTVNCALQTVILS